MEPSDLPTRSYPQELGVEWGKPPPGDVLSRIPWADSTAPEQN